MCNFRFSFILSSSGKPSSKKNIFMLVYKYLNVQKNIRKIFQFYLWDDRRTIPLCELTWNRMWMERFYSLMESFWETSDNLSLSTHRFSIPISYSKPNKFTVMGIAAYVETTVRIQIWKWWDFRTKGNKYSLWYIRSKEQNKLLYINHSIKCIGKNSCIFLSDTCRWHWNDSVFSSLLKVDIFDGITSSCKDKNWKCYI